MRVVAMLTATALTALLFASGGVAASARTAESGSAATTGSVRTAEDPALTQYWRVPFSGEIWELTPSGEFILSWQEWSARGFPTPTDLKPSYVKYPWSPNIWGQSVLPAHPGFDTTLPARAIQDKLTYEGWTAVGRPNPTIVPWINGSNVVAWGSSPDLFLKETFGNYHKLTYAEWKATGFKAFVRHPESGFQKLSWDGSGNIAYMCDIAGGRGAVLTYKEWKAAGSPTPQAVTRTPHDIVWWEGSGDIFYDGAIKSGRLSYREWQSMGAPAPRAYADESSLSRCSNTELVPGRNDVP